MIHDSISNAAAYAALHPRFAAAFAWLRDHAASAEPGRHEVAGQDLFVNVDHTSSHAFIPEKFELHHRYVDIQFLVEGEEEIWVGSPAGMDTVIPFSESKDVAWLRKETTAGLHRIVMHPGEFLILKPWEEAHQPAVAPDTSTPGSPIRKAIAKVLSV